MCRERELGAFEYNVRSGAIKLIGIYLSMEEFVLLV